MQLSVAIMCKDNEATIGRTLDSVAGLADEIVAMDSGSTDGTLGLLERAGARVVSTPWLGYVATRQKSIEACRGEWVLVLDSDESVLPALADSITEAMTNPGDRSGFEVNRKIFYRDRALNFAWQPEWRLRLVRRGLYRVAGLNPHDYIEPIRKTERIGRLSGDLRHDAICDWSSFLARQIRHARTSAAAVHADGRRGSRLRLLTSPSGAFLKQLVLKQAWRDGTPGWIAAGSVAIGGLAKQSILLELGMEEASEVQMSNPTTTPPRPR